MDNNGFEIGDWVRTKVDTEVGLYAYQQIKSITNDGSPVTELNITLFPPILQKVDKEGRVWEFTKELPDFTKEK
jgi:hypothetical protein